MADHPEHLPQRNAERAGAQREPQRAQHGEGQGRDEQHVPPAVQEMRAVRERFARLRGYFFRATRYGRHGLRR
ncbi:MAG: hypothetical protein ACRDUV_20055 [Pseudonocardiaceae bacterium]